MCNVKEKLKERSNFESISRKCREVKRHKVCLVLTLEKILRIILELSRIPMIKHFDETLFILLTVRHEKKGYCYNKNIMAYFHTNMIEANKSNESFF